MRLEIHIQREIARLHFQDIHRSHREIARSTGAAPNTVSGMRELLTTAGVAWEAIKDLVDEEWCKVLKNEDRTNGKRKVAPDWQVIHEEMTRPDATLEILWREFKQQQPDGVAYTQFTAGYSAWKKKRHVAMRQEHVPGKKLFVDFAGRTLPITNPETGVIRHAQVFVGVLGYSNYTYVEAVESQKIPDWVTCHAHCFEALGGATEWVVCDRLKSGVLGTVEGDIQITPAYREVLKHYGSAPMPAGARKPKHKAKAEVGVQIAQRWILFRLRDRVFFSLDEANAEIRKLNDALNDHPFKKLDGTRRSRFDAVERQALQPLPATRYEYCDWRYKVLVGADHHLEHERCFYSVPFHLARERVDLRVTRSMIEIHHRGRRVAMHPRLTVPGEVCTLKEHRPIEHVRVLDGEPKALAMWAATNGVYTSQMFEYHLTVRTDLTNGVRAARRLRELAEQYGANRLEEVCAYALPLNITALRSLTSIFKESADKRSRAAAAPSSNQSHANVRGPEYFGEKS